MTEYPATDDWSFEGRNTLVARMGDEIRALLDDAFFRFSDHYELAPFGFRGEDPVNEATEWAIENFCAREFDPSRIDARDRSLRLFTRPEFWLAFKAGAAQLERVKRRRNTSVRDDALAFQKVSGSSRTDAGIAVEALLRKMAETLGSLARRTCADLVGYWLEHTASLRARMGWAPAQAVVTAKPSSPKAASQYGHDALFRYQCLFEGLVPADRADREARAVEGALFQACANRPPYRRTLDAVRDELRVDGNGDAQVEVSIRNGAEGLVLALAEAVDQAWSPVSAERDGVDAVRFLLLRGALAPTTLDALGIGKRDELRTRVRELPKLQIAEDRR